MQRQIQSHIKKDLKQKLVLLSGPRQVGKTTLSKQLGLSFDYLNLDSARDTKTIKEEVWDREKQLIIFDELHKTKNWKSWIKGVYDTEGIPPSYLITGSARLDVYRKAGDSLSGRYFSYRLHPITVKEALPLMNAQSALERILTMGGFPEPFLKNNLTFSKRWRRQHMDTILREDLIDLERVREIKSVELLVELLRERVGSPVSYSSLAVDLQVSIPTVKHWLQILENLYVIFSVRPYHKNIARSLLKEPKYYFYDTGAVDAPKGMKLENAIASMLLAELQHLEDTTGCRTSLHYLRDREKREVDFCVVIDKKPTHLIEVKLSDENFSPHLFHFKQFFKEVTTIQLVHEATRSKTKNGVRLMPASQFLENISLQSN